MTVRLPPGVHAKSQYYIHVQGILWMIPDTSYWVSRFKNDRFNSPTATNRWNVDHRFADPFNTEADAKKVMRSLAKRLDLKKAEFSIVEVTANYTARKSFPLEVLDRLARVMDCNAVSGQHSSC